MRELSRRESLLAIVAGFVLLLAVGSRTLLFIDHREEKLHHLVEARRILEVKASESGDRVYMNQREIEHILDELTDSIHGLRRVEISGGEGSMTLSFSGSAKATWWLLAKLREVRGILIGDFSLSRAQSGLNGVVRLEIES